MALDSDLAIGVVEEAGANLLFTFERVRAVTEALSAPLSAEDQTVQSMPDASPTKWHLAHTTWFWETFVLEPHAPCYRVCDPRHGFLFNSYYEALGRRHARAQRGLISRPSVEDVLAYREHVNAGMARFAETAPETFAELGDLIALGIAHEEQHQELLLTDIKHALSMNPFWDAAYPAPPADGRPAGREADGAVRWVSFAETETEIGARGNGFAFDNETPRHRALLGGFALASRPVTNREYLAFIDDGGYRTPALWLSDGWAEVCAAERAAPLYWRRGEDGWETFTLHGPRPLDLDAPVAHLSYYEASAFAEWAGARLPDEGEWEHAAAALDPSHGHFLDPASSCHPAPAPARGPSGSGDGLAQMFGDVWEWTRSSYAAYPRYRPVAGAIGEYNGKFMCGQYVLKGGSCATPRGHVRASYRNFFPPGARWQFSGVRLARDT